MLTDAKRATTQVPQNVVLLKVRQSLRNPKTSPLLYPNRVSSAFKLNKDPNKNRLPITNPIFFDLYVSLSRLTFPDARISLERLTYFIIHFDGSWYAPQLDIELFPVARLQLRFTDDDQFEVS